MPQLAEIDAITGDLPCLFHRRCLHIIYMNSAAIELLGLNGDKAEEINPKMAIVRGSDGRGERIFKSRSPSVYNVSNISIGHFTRGLRLYQIVEFEVSDKRTTETIYPLRT